MTEPWAGDCPDASVLQRLGSREFTDSEQVPLSGAMEQHIETCGRCQAVLEDMAVRQREHLTPLLNRWTRRSPDQSTAADARPGASSPGGSTSDADEREAALPQIPGFRMVRELGRGGGAVVYLVEDLTTSSRLVALKLLAVEAASSASLRKQWLDEVHVAARMEHPNVVRLYRVEETPNYFLLVFEYVAGGTLRDWLHTSAPPLQIARLIHTIALAVHQIHQRDILHLDLKPSNILIDTSGGTDWEQIVPKVADFGISSCLRSQTTSPTGPECVRGTPAYMAPEQFLGDPAALSRATDVYGLGGILFSLLTGVPPFQAETDTRLVRRVLDEPVEWTPVKAHDVPDGLRDIALRCLAKYPEARFASCQDLAEALQQWINTAALSRPALPGGLPRVLRPRLLATLILVALAAVWMSGSRLADPAGFGGLSSRQTGAKEAYAPLGIHEWADEIAREAAAFDVPRADRLLYSTRHHNDHVLSATPVSFELCLRYGTLQLRAAERFQAGLDKGLYAAASQLLNESVRLLETAVALQSEDQSAIAELVAARFLLSQLKDSDEVTSPEKRRRQCEKSAVIIVETAPLIGHITDQHRRVYWTAGFLDYFRMQSWNFRWRREFETAQELERNEDLFWRQLPQSDKCPDLAIRHALLQPQIVAAGWPAIPQRGWILEESHSRMVRDTLLTFLAEQLWAVGLPVESSGRSEAFSAERMLDAGRGILNKTRQFMDAHQMPEELLTDVIHAHLIPPITGISTDLRREARLDEAEAIQRVFLSLGEACRERWPANADCHLIVCEAHLQAWKNSLRRDAPEAAVKSLQRSLEAAEAALRIAPNSIRARLQVADRIKRLTRFQDDQIQVSQPDPVKSVRGRD